MFEHAKQDCYRSVRRWALLFSIAGGCGAAAATQPGPDPSDVRIRGDGTLFNMRIVAVRAAEGSFTVETTGARFEYDRGELKVFQGLRADKRLLAQIALAQRPAFELREQTDDHVLLTSTAANVGVYGDSTLIIAPHAALGVRCQGNFKPGYEGTYRGELLLIDDAGGLAVSPARYGPAYEHEDPQLDRPDWVATYVLPPGQRLMVTAFPGRPFDWEKSFHSNIVLTSGGMGRGAGNGYGQMPSEEEAAALARWFDIVCVLYQGLYERGTSGREYPPPGGPYTVANPVEWRRFVAAAHRHGLKVAVYTSPYYYVSRGGSMEAYFGEVAALQRDFQIDGVYLDGLLNDMRNSRPVDDKVGSWETVRRLRQMFGKDGVLILHGTAIDNPVGVLPNMDTYCDLTLYGEGVVSKNADDPYVRYRVRKYGISNTVGIWYSAHESQLSWPERLRAILAMNCRMRWGSYVSVDKPPPNNHYVWTTQPDAGYLKYRQALREIEDNYHRGLRPAESGDRPR